MTESVSTSSSVMSKADSLVDSKYRNYSELRRHGFFRLGIVVGFGRLWFVKSLVPECSGLSDCRNRLYKEYDILANLNHPSVVRVMSLEEIPEAGLSIIMEYVEGVHLDEFVSGADALSRRVIANALCEAVAFIHSRGIVHLDLKPENILVRGSRSAPSVCLIDFNLSDGDVFCYNKEVGGNLRYAAPEQFEEGYKASPTADVWSLGKLIEEIAPGRMWSQAVRKAQESDPALRPADASAFIALAKKGRRTFIRRIVLIAAAVVVFLSLLAAVAIHDNRIPAEPVSPDDTQQPAVAVEEENSTETDAPRGDGVAEVPVREVAPVATSPAATPAADKFAALEKEHDMEVEKVRKRCMAGIEEMKAAEKEVDRSKGSYALEFATKCTEIERDIFAPLMVFRLKCPEELLSRHSYEWCSWDDPALKGEGRRFRAFKQELINKMFEEEKRGRKAY